MPTPGVIWIGGQLQLSSNGYQLVSARQAVSTSSVNQPHGIVIKVSRGPVRFKVGSTEHGSEIAAEISLRTGIHSLQVTPTVSPFWIEIGSRENGDRLVDSISIAPAGDIVLPTTWTEDQLQSLRFTQSADVAYVAVDTGMMHRIERRGNKSWSITESRADDGPYLPRTPTTYGLSPTVKSGIGSLTSSKSLFKAGHNGALFQITHSGQAQTKALSGADQWTDPIKVTGVNSSGDNQRSFIVQISGTWTGTVTLQRSVGNTNAWTDQSTWTSNAGPITTNDNLDNQIIYYRLGFKGGDYGSGTATASLIYSGGATTGVCRVLGIVSDTSAYMEVITAFSDTVASTQWSEGSWSDARYWPAACQLHDGRLWTGDVDLVWGSVSNGYESQKSGENASDAISRAIATGSMNQIQWILGLERLLFGTAGAIAMMRSSALDEPLTPTNLTVRDISTIGAGNVEPAKIDTQGIFIGRDGERAYEIAYESQKQSYVVHPLMRLHRYLGAGGITQIAVQRQPDTRVYMIRADGQCLVLLYDPQDSALGWSRLVTDGLFETVEVLPGASQDSVHFVVARKAADGVTTIRTLEEFGSFRIETVADIPPIDSYVCQESDVASTTLSGLGHLEGRSVVAWADGYCVGRKTVSGALSPSRARPRSDRPGSTMRGSIRPQSSRSERRPARHTP